MMKKVLCVLALWYFADWAYQNKIKPFVMKELHLKDSTAAVAPPPVNVGTTPAPADTPVAAGDTAGVLAALRSRLMHAGPGAGMNTGSFVYGIDISHYQGDEADYLQRKKDSLIYVICKATEGVNTIDSKFKTNWELLRQKRIIRGAYHFYHCTSDPIQQAVFFMNTVDSFKRADLPPVIDVEEASYSSSCNTANVQRDILRFLDTVYRRTGQLPMIYTNYSTGDTKLTDTAFARYPLWVADYKTGAKAPRIPRAWAKVGWAFWQKTDSYSVKGYTNDLDIFNGNLLGLGIFIGQH